MNTLIEELKKRGLNKILLDTTETGKSIYMKRGFQFIDNYIILKIKNLIEVFWRALKISMINRLVGRIAYYFMKRYARKSEGQTIDLIIDHVLPGISPEMLDWWWDNIKDTERYKFWHPKSHKYFKWEVFTDKHVGNIHVVLENIGRITTKLRIRWEDPNQQPIQTKYEHVAAGSILDDEDNPISWITHEYESVSEGTKMKSTFRLPEKAPKWFVESLRKHNIEEMAEFPNFLPELYQENK